MYFIVYCLKNRRYLQIIHKYTLSNFTPCVPQRPLLQRKEFRFHNYLYTGCFMFINDHQIPTNIQLLGCQLIQILKLLYITGFIHQSISYFQYPYEPYVYQLSIIVNAYESKSVEVTGKVYATMIAKNELFEIRFFFYFPTSKLLNEYLF